MARSWAVCAVCAVALGHAASPAFVGFVPRRHRVPAQARREAHAEVHVPHDRVRVWAISDVHVDKPANRRWLDRIVVAPAEGAYNVLIVAGDVATSCADVGGAVERLLQRFDEVQYVPGNHEAWLDDRQRDATSLDKLARVRGAARAAGARQSPTTYVDGGGRRCTVVPLQSWYHADWDTEPALQPQAGRRSFRSMWVDYRECAWPEGLNGTAIADAAAALNEDALAELEDKKALGAIVSFSHFLPTIDCLPEKRFIVDPALPSVVGSRPLAAQIRRLGDDVALHVFGHTHIPLDMPATEERPRVVSWPLGSPREQAKQTGPVGAHGPLCVFDTADGAAPQTPTAWGLYYDKHARDTSITELAPWVQCARARRRAAHGEGARRKEDAPPPVAALLKGPADDDDGVIVANPAPPSAEGQSVFVERVERAARGPEDRPTTTTA